MQIDQLLLGRWAAAEVVQGGRLPAEGAAAEEVVEQLLQLEAVELHRLLLVRQDRHVCLCLFHLQREEEEERKVPQEAAVEEEGEEKVLRRLEEVEVVLPALVPEAEGEVEVAVEVQQERPSTV